MQQSFEKGEIMCNARRLILAKGDRALAYAEKMAERKQELGEDEDEVFWGKIAKQIDLLLYEPD